jgi:macrolide transport system ATP-binding/permease protein
VFAILLSCHKVTKSFGDKIVLNNVNIDICRNDRIGLVGQNGVGKTTLANILAGSLDYDRGSIITTRQELNIGYLRQSKVEPELFLNVLSNETKINGEFQRLTSHLGINRIHDWSEEQLRNLSGGEKTKLALAAVLATQPNLIILDEPTNHMGYPGVEYLIAELLLLETRISWVISELTRYKPGEPDYLALEQEYTELIEQRKRLNMGR